MVGPTASLIGKEYGRSWEYPSCLSFLLKTILIQVIGDEEDIREKIVEVFLKDRSGVGKTRVRLGPRR